MIKLDKNGLSIFRDFHAYKTSNFKKKYILKDNSSDEILEAVKEIESRLNNSFIETKKNNENQKKFWGIFKKSGLFNHYIKRVDPRSRISKKFIYKNQWIIK